MQRYYHIGEIDRDYLRGNPDNFILDEVAPMVSEASGMPRLAVAGNYSGLVTSRQALAQLFGFDCYDFWIVVANDFHGVVTPKDPEDIRNGVCYLVRAMFDEHGNELPREDTGCHF